MKKFFIISQLILFTFLISSCDEDSTGPEDPGNPNPTGMFIQSNPDSAQIWVDGDYKGLTPDSVLNLTAGNHSVRLYKLGYADANFNVNVVDELISTPSPVSMTQTGSVYGPIQIWESSGTGASMPSGLDLSAGNPIAISGNDAADADIYFETNQLVITNSEADPSAVFNIGSGTNLEDSTNSPLALGVGQGGWLQSVSINEDNYFFIFDEELHYTKMKIVETGTTGGSRWVRLMWVFNLTTNNTNF